METREIGSLLKICQTQILVAEFTDVAVLPGEDMEVGMRLNGDPSRMGSPQLISQLLRERQLLLTFWQSFVLQVDLM